MLERMEVPGNRDPDDIRTPLSPGVLAYTFCAAKIPNGKKPFPKTPHKQRRRVMPRVGTRAVTLPRRFVPCYFFPLLFQRNRTAFGLPQRQSSMDRLQNFYTAVFAIFPSGFFSRLFHAPLVVGF